MPPTIEIAPNLLLIDVNAGETADRVFIHWKSENISRPFLWERRVGESWSRIPVSPSQFDEGNTSRVLEVGTAYQVAMFHLEDADPNSGLSDPEPVAFATASALRKESPSGLIAFEEFGPTGTSFGWFPTTLKPTFAVMQIGGSEPSETEDGVLFFETPLFTTHGGFTQNHSLSIASSLLFPGNVFWAILRLTDSDGRWQFRKEEFTTWRRTVEILLKEIRIINDGAEGNNRASFRIWVCEGKHFIHACALSEREISDRPSPGQEFLEHIGLSADCQIPITIGPTVVTKDRRRVSILTRGIAEVIIGTDDISGNFIPNNRFPANVPTESAIFEDAFLRLPIGAHQEQVEDEDFQVFAEPFTTDNEFMYEVNGTYSVTYNP